MGRNANRPQYIFARCLGPPRISLRFIFLFGSIGIPLSPAGGAYIFPAERQSASSFRLMMKVKGMESLQRSIKRTVSDPPLEKNIHIFRFPFCTDSLDNSTGHHFPKAALPACPV